MFIKITKTKNHHYVQIVQSYREGGTVKHKVLLNLGRLDEMENNPSFQRLGLRLLELSKAKGVAKLGDFSEAQIKNWGYMVYQKIWQKFELPAILKALSAQRKVQFDLHEACFLWPFSTCSNREASWLHTFLSTVILICRRFL